jgi:4-hydroxy-tetrahydrodipicolinate synthase
MRMIPDVSALGRRATNHPSGSLSQIGGSVTALVTPFRDGRVDGNALAALCERQIRGGTAALVVCGSTGEAAALSPAEQARVVAIAVDAASNRVAVIAGCGAPATDAATALAIAAARNGATAVLCAPPPYSRPTQEGIAAHVRAVAHATDLPLVLYDVPGRVGVAVADETVARLHESGLVMAIKDAAGDLSRPARLQSLCGGELIQFSGDDATAPAYRAMGGHGCISVSANLVPALCAEMHAAWDQVDLIEFARIRDLLTPLHRALLLESNPIPVKAALCMVGLCNGDLRLPLIRACSATLDALGMLLPGVVRAEDAAGAAGLARLSLVT